MAEEFDAYKENASFSGNGRGYRINTKALILIYLAASLPALVLSIGIPIGNILLGILAGLYLGQRYVYFKIDKNCFSGECAWGLRDSS